LPKDALRRITLAIRDSERQHRGEIRFAVEASMSLGRLLRGQSARARALELFSALQTWDTEENNGVLIYLLLAERTVEIIADRGIDRRVAHQRWQEICHEMEAEFRQGRCVGGCLAGIRSVGLELERHYGGTDLHGDELPNEPALL
jgi:uncharacterized membrane protein